MLEDKDAMATVGVKDLQAARKFYEGTLGLKLADGRQEPGTAAYKTGGSRLLVYQSQDFPGVTRIGDVHVAGHLKNAWFKDPDGNIHAVVGG